MSDMSGKPVTFVLFKAEAPGVKMYITEKGFTYVFIKAEKEAYEKEKNEISDGTHEENLKIE